MSDHAPHLNDSAKDSARLGDGVEDSLLGHFGWLGNPGAKRSALISGWDASEDTCSSTSKVCIFPRPKIGVNKMQTFDVVLGRLERFDNGLD